MRENNWSGSLENLQWHCIVQNCFFSKLSCTWCFRGFFLSYRCNRHPFFNHIPYFSGSKMVAILMLQKLYFSPSKIGITWFCIFSPFAVKYVKFFFWLSITRSPDYQYHYFWLSKSRSLLQLSISSPIINITDDALFFFFFLKKILLSLFVLSTVKLWYHVDYCVCFTIMKEKKRKWI